MEYRLNKYISSSGICSRREADRFIEEGRVTINGKRATLGMRVLPGQKVKVNGSLIVNDVEPVYIAFNKPVGIVSTTDPQEKDNIVDFIRHQQRIFPVGRLDKDSQGLILLTNDGDIVNKILRAGNNHKKEYLVTVNRPITEEFLTKMAHGVPILDRVTRKCEIKMISPYIFHITLIQGLNRQIRRMCEYFNYEVTKLERIQIMHIKLGNLKQGYWRNLTEPELETLFDMIEDSENTVKQKSSPSKKSDSGKKDSEENGPESREKKSRIPKAAASSKSNASFAGQRAGGGQQKGRSSRSSSGNSSSQGRDKQQSGGRRGRQNNATSQSGGRRGASTSSRGGSKRR